MSSVWGSDGDETSFNGKRTISFSYLVKGLEVGVDEVERIKNIDLQNLQKQRKLCLVLDLDHTLLHSKSLSRRDGRFFWKGHHDIYRWKIRAHEYYITKLRPFVKEFLDKVSQMFELYVYTMASRDYALHVVNEFLDPQGIYFGKRVIAKEDCTVRGLKGLDVVPVHPRAVLILDDKECVWKGNFDNLIVIDKYYYNFSQVGGDESEGEEELRFALEALTKIHTVYFNKWNDSLMDSDVRELMQIHWENIMEQGQQEIGTGTSLSDMGVGKNSTADDECSSGTKRKRK